MRFLKFAAVAISLMFLTSCLDDSPARMREMRAMIPEMIEIFEQSKEYLDVLRDGNFAYSGRGVGSNNGLIISYGTGGIPYEEWDTIEWLSDKERDALLFLYRSEELGRNFLQIGSPAREISIGAMIYRVGDGPRTNNIAIWHSGRPRSAFIEDYYTVDLGDGYVLWIYTLRGGL